LGVFENEVLRRIFGPKMEKVVGGWRRLHSEKLHNLCTSQNIISVIKSRRIRWEGVCSPHGGDETAYVDGRDHSEDLGLDGKAILE
jgi:hypothetical protein